MTTPTQAPVPLQTDIPSAAEVISGGLQAAGETTSRFVATLPLLGTRLLMAGGVILLGLLILRYGRKLLRRILLRKGADSVRTVHQRETLRSLMSSVFNYLMYFVIATAVLSIFGVNVSSIIAVAGVGGVAIGFGAQTLVKDIISGIFLWAEGNISVGDMVQVNSLTGAVESISLRTTTLRDYNGSLYVVPNGDIRTVTNINRDFRRALVDVRLSYEEDLDAMLSILKDEMAKSEEGLTGLRETPQVLGITAMQADSITVQIAALCDAASAVDIERALRRRIKNRFDKERILFPHAPVMDTPRKK